MDTRSIGRIIGTAALVAASSAWAHPGHAASEPVHFFFQHLAPALAVIGLIGYGGLRVRLWLERRGAGRRRVRP